MKDLVSRQKISTEFDGIATRIQSNNTEIIIVTPSEEGTARIVELISSDLAYSNKKFKPVKVVFEKDIT